MTDRDDQETYFAPAQRATAEELTAQLRRISNNPVVDGLMNAASGLLAVLNEERQVLAVNESFLQMLGLSNWEAELGIRLGEAIDCVYADTGPGGCGTSEYCSSCGAAVAMVTALGMNKPVERTCAVTVDRNGRKADLFFRVRSFPVTFDDTRFLLLFLQDHTQPQQWAALERAFFHDISNVLAALLPVSEMVSDAHKDDPAAQHLERLTLRLTQEVALQKALLRSGISGYQPVYFQVSASDILDELMSTFSHHELAATRSLNRPDNVPQTLFKTDFALVVRILGNMIINALEATSEGGQVKLGVEASDDSLAFTVWNREAIPDDVARRVFQRNFSTKPGTGRGLGTYFMKVFGEQVLGGEVDFVTSEEAGTTFRFRVDQKP